MATPAYAHGLVILPPPRLRNELMALRRRHPLLQAPIPPHITVKSPFLFRGTVATVVEILERVCAEFEPFEIELRGLSTFGETGVVYIPVQETPDLLDLHNALLEELEGYVETLNGKYEGDAFTPHMTVTDRLAPEDFHSVRKQLAGFFPRWRFTVDRLHLLRGRGRWDVTRSFPLGAH